MIIGTFTYNEATDSYKGDIVTLNFQLTGVDITATDKVSSKEPDYRVSARTGKGQVELGAAWKRTSDRGREFVSVSLDAPLLAAPINAALFLDKNEIDAALVWNRSKSKTKEQDEPSTKAA